MNHYENFPMTFLLGMTIIKEAPVTNMKSLLKVGAGDSLSLEY